MGFCRHCGNIVAGERCSTCGGIAVAPAVSLRRTESSTRQDRWSKTYVSSDNSSVSPASKVESSTSDLKGSTTAITTPKASSPSPFALKRFPRPKSLSVAPLSLNRGVSEHITHATSSTRPPSPLKLSTTLSDTENDILPSFLPHEPTLSKVYGSVLQPKDTLILHSCAVCAVVFSPDTTIYPNPSPTQSGKQTFLCKACFTENGGSKGTCPACSRPVLALKSEGAFIQSGGSYWHKQCYNCAGCFKNIGDAPMVDLLGRPSCVECFDNCLKKDHPTTPKKNRAPSNNNSPNFSPSFSNPGGLNTSYGPGRPSRESSPALEELEQRLGLAKSRDSSPRADSGRSLSPRKMSTSTSDSPLRPRLTTPLASLPDVRERVNVRGKSTERCTVSKAAAEIHSVTDLTVDELSSSSPPPDQTSSAVRPLSSSTKNTPQQSTITPSKSLGRSENHSTTTTSLSTSPPSNTCNKCGQNILNSRDGGQFVTIPGADENTVPRVYHSDCFKCGVCDKPFNDSKKGPASFVISPRGPCHTQCTPSEPTIVHKSIPLNRLPEWAPTIPQDLPTWTSKKLNPGMPPPALPDKSSPLSPRSTSPSKSAFPRFGGQASCPGCHKAVSSMEKGVVPGPQGSKWHSSCLVCGGRKEVTRAVLLGRLRDDTKKPEPGCGKKLDSAAKIDGEGGVWCRECLLFIGVGGSPQSSPGKSTTSSICIPGRVNPQPTLSGMTTLARQFTGLGAHDPILGQLTGGNLSPTRSISPTKQLGMMGSPSGMRPRPKSVIGSVRISKSVDEGRGMFLVRQMTGSSTSSNGGWGER